IGPITQALALAEDRGWTQPSTNARAFHIALSMLGVEVDDDEFEKGQAQLLDRRGREIDSLLPQRNLADALKKLQAGNSNGSQQVQ
ncbi:MAG TPA: hypothetical protein VFZ27_17410, partial [Terriglobia bacterium]|nr:hypothetical protein [Terriglobia bacterium]